MATFEKWIRGYFDDFGNQWAVLVPKFWSNVGHRQWDGWNDQLYPQIPDGLIMRHWNLKSADGKRRRNIPASRAWWEVAPPIGATVTLPNMDGSTTVWTVVGYNSERYQPKKYRKKKR